MNSLLSYSDQRVLLALKERLMRIYLVNPSDAAFGVGVITPRWLYVRAATATLRGSRYRR